MARRSWGRLARAYRTAHHRTQARLRELLAGDGDVDVLRIMAEDAHHRTAHLAADEREYLAGLARRAVWPAAGLWWPPSRAAGTSR